MPMSVTPSALSPLPECFDNEAPENCVRETISSDYRVPLGRMLIRYLAALLPNKKNIVSHGISEFSLSTDKVDK